MYGVGIDLGTSFAAAAVARQGTVDMVQLGDQTTVIPSVVFLNADGSMRTGEPADRLGLQTPDQVAREVRRRLGDPTPLVLGGSLHSPATLMAVMLSDMIAAVRRARSDEPAQRVVLTHPAVWGPYRREQFAAVPQLAGLTAYPEAAAAATPNGPAPNGPAPSGPTVRLVTEPVAAATYYCSQHPLPPDGLLAVYDLGGGTFDAAVVRNGVDELEILGTPEGIERLGGADLDQTVVDHVDRQLAGALSALDAADPTTAAILADVRRRCTVAKEALSTRDQADITVHLPGATHHVVLTRDAFEQMVTPALDTTIEAFRRALNTSGVTPQDLTAVLLVGGSSQIPLVSTLLRDALQHPIRINTHPKHSVALGAALLSARPAPATPRRTATLHHSAPDGTPIPRQPAPIPPQPVARATTPGSGVRRRRPAGIRARLNGWAGIGPWLSGWAGRVTLAAAVAATATVALALTQPGGTGSPGTGSPGTGSSIGARTGESAPAGVTSPGELVVFDGSTDTSPRPFISSADNDWIGLPVTPGTARAGASITVTAVATGAPGGPSLHARWSGSGPAQLYLQDSTSSDLRTYGAAATALVFDVVVHTRPAAPTAIAIHCVYPCSSEVQATRLLRSLPVEQRTTVRIPLQCFVGHGLDLSRVDTYFVISTHGRFDASFSRIRWTPGAADDPEAIACDALT